MEHWHPSTIEQLVTIPHIGWENAGRHASNAASLIVVGDDEPAASALAGHLQEKGFVVIRVNAGGCALAYLGAGGACDAIVVELDVAVSAGLPWFQRIARTGASPPILILRDAGGDVPAQLAQCNRSVDFVDRTPQLTDVADRIGSLIDATRTDKGQDFDAHPVECGPLRLKPNVCRAYWRDRKVPLTMTEFRIVLKLAAQPDEDVSYRDIYDVVHGEGFIAGEGDQGYRANVRSLIKKIRKKFGAIDDGFDAIENYPGFGYRWVGHRYMTAGEAEPIDEIRTTLPTNGHGAEPQFGHLLEANGPTTIVPVSICKTESAKGTSTMGALRRDRSAGSAAAGNTAVARRGADATRNGSGDAGDPASDLHHGFARGDGVNGMNGHDQNGATDPSTGQTLPAPPESPEVRRPWGCFQTVDSGDRFQVKRIVVQPGSRLSLQMHHHRAEHWIVVHGTAKVFRDGETLLLRSNESLYIPSGAKHRLENPGKVPLLLIEVQWGDYLGEDDIVRFEDSYGRV